MIWICNHLYLNMYMEHTLVDIDPYKYVYVFLSLVQFIFLGVQAFTTKHYNTSNNQKSYAKILWLKTCDILLFKNQENVA